MQTVSRIDALLTPDSNTRMTTYTPVFDESLLGSPVRSSLDTSMPLSQPANGGQNENVSNLYLLSIG